MKKYILLAIISIFSMCAQAAGTTDSCFVTLPSGTSWKASLIRVVDKVTGFNISGGTVSNVVITNNNPEVATVDTSISTSNIKVTRVASGSGTATITCRVNYTDPGDGLPKTEDRSITLFYTVEGSPHGAKLSLSF